MSGWQDPHGERSVSSDEIMTGLGRRLPARMGEEVIASPQGDLSSLFAAENWRDKRAHVVCVYVNAADPHASGPITCRIRRRSSAGEGIRGGGRACDSMH